MVKGGALTTTSAMMLIDAVAWISILLKTYLFHL